MALFPRAEARRRRIVVLGLLAAACLARPAGAIEIVVAQDSGQAYLTNPDATSATIDSISLFSPSASLLPGAWISVTDAYDVDGDQSVDDSAEWFVISATSSSLAEASTTAFSGALAPGQVVPLGPIFEVGDPEVLAVNVTAGTTVTPVVGVFRSFIGDFDGDLDVDDDDFGVFAGEFGSSGLPPGAPSDFDMDGDVDDDDFGVFVGSFGNSVLTGAVTSLSLASPALLTVASSPIPEPTAFAFAVIAVVCTPLRRR